MKVILHIGHEKTGTTSLQRFLVTHYSQPGGDLYFARTGRQEGKELHRALYDTLAGGLVDVVEEEMSRELSTVDAEKTVFSCEMFSCLTPASNLALDRFLDIGKRRGWEVSVVCAVRPAHAFLRSLYMESLKWGFVMDYVSFVKMHLPRLFDAKLEAIAASHGAEIIFLPYGKEDSIRQFMKVTTGRDDVVETGERNLNARIPEWMAPFLLLTSRTFGSAEFTRQASDAALRLNSSAPEWFDAEVFFALPNELAMAIDAIENTDAVRRRLFGDGAV